MKDKDNNLYDLIIIGAGPAGLSAALYAVRFKLKALALSKDLGGTLQIASDISNFPGQKELKGPELAQIFINRVKDKIEIIKEKAEVVLKTKKEFLVKTKGKNFKSKAVILAIGAPRKKIGVPGEKEFERKGVSYCALCDAPLFKNKTVAVIGGANAALHSAIMLSNYAKEVFILARRGLRADPVLVDRVTANKKIKIIRDINIKEIQGNNFVERVILSRNIKGKNVLELQGVFIEIGIEPETSVVKGLKIKKDKDGFLKVNEEMETNISGLYAAGDISTGSIGLKQVITAVSEGVIAANSAYNKLRK